MRKYVYKITVAYEFGDVIETYVFKKHLPKRLAKSQWSDSKAIKVKYETIENPFGNIDSEHVYITEGKAYSRKEYRKEMRNDSPKWIIVKRKNLK